MPDNALLEAALAYAADGIPVFPCDQHKHPLCVNGHKDATTNADQICAWWEATPEANIACVPGLVEWCVVDLDPPDGVDNYHRLAAGFGELPDTWTVRTPRGGLHLYYQGHLPPSVGKSGLAPHVDTRGDNSYVLLPPSSTADGVYTVVCEADIAPLPEWIAPLLANRKRQIVEGKPDVELDLPANLRRAELFLRNHRPLREKDGCDQAVYVAACKLRELGISADTAAEMLGTMLDIEPKDDRFDSFIERKVDNAYRYGQNGSGAYAGGKDTFAAFGREHPQDSATASGSGASNPKETRSAFHFADEAEQNEEREPTWLIPDLIPDEATVVLVGATGSFKSFLAQDIALATAAGLPTFGQIPVRTGPVFYAAHEGRPAVKKQRRLAWKQARGVTASIPDFYVGRAPMIAQPEQVEEFVQEIAKRAGERRPALIVIDTLAKCMVGLNEDKASDASLFVQFCDNLRDTFRCAILVLHHTGKDADKGGRGSSAYQAGFDTTLQIEELDKEIRKATRVVKLKVVQHKDADEREKPWCFQGRPTGPSLAFFPISDSEYSVLASGQEAYSQAKIAHALRKIGAAGPNRAVATHILAIELTPHQEDESVDVLNGRIAATRSKLVTLARTHLKGFCMRTDKDLLWFLPAAL